MIKQLKRPASLYSYRYSEKMPHGPRRLNLLSAELYGDSTEIYGTASSLLKGNCSGLLGNITELRGDITGLKGDCSGLTGDCTGIWGDCTGISGNIYACEITDEEKKNGINIETLVKRGEKNEI